MWWIQKSGTMTGNSENVEIHSRNCVFDGFFKIEEVDFRHQRIDGDMSPVLRRLHLERGDGAAVVVHNVQRRCFVFVRQFRYSTHEQGPGGLLETIAGVIEPGQAPEKVARRELLEEAGYRARELEFVSSFYLTLGGSSERIFLFFAEVEDADRVARGGGLDAEGEDIEVVEMTETEVWRALDAGEIVDAKTLVGLLSYRQRRGGS